MVQVLKDLDAAMNDVLVQAYMSDAKSKKLQGIQSKFFTTVRNTIEYSGSLCIRDSDGNVPKEVTNNPKRHKTRYMNKLQSPYPEVLTFNLIWDNGPKPSDILKVLVSLPEVFAPKEMYGANGTSVKYVLKGMICFQAAHYLAFFRRILIKYDYLETDYSTV